MSNKEHVGGVDPDEQTVQTAGQIVKYTRELYHLDDVTEVATFALEATPQIIDGAPNPAVIEIEDGDMTVLESMLTGLDPGDTPGDMVRRAYDHDLVIIAAPDSTTIAYDEDDVTIADPTGSIEGKRGGVTVIAPVVYQDGERDAGAIVVVNWPKLDRVEKFHVKPVEYLAEHVATAVVNIRSRERLELARNDLAKRKEMVEIYDRLLRHDLGNDLQVMSGFSDHLQRMLDEDHEAYEYVERIHVTSGKASQLIDKVGDTVHTLQDEGAPEAKPLEPIIADVVERVNTKYDRLTIDYDPADFQYEIFAGDLIDSVFSNVLSNAAEHNDGDVHVRIYTEEPTNESVVVGMADDGSGVSNKVRNELFKMGKKGPDSDGTGFGLGLVRSLVEWYGGDIELRDSESGGADIRLTLRQV